MVVRLKKGIRAPRLFIVADFASDIELRTPEGLCLIGSEDDCSSEDQGPCAGENDYCLDVFQGQDGMKISYSNISDPGGFTVAFEGVLTADLWLTVAPVGQAGEATLTFTQNDGPYCAAIDVIPECALCEQYPNCKAFDAATVELLNSCEDATGETCPTTTVTATTMTPTTTTPENCASFNCSFGLDLLKDAMTVFCNPCSEDECCQPPTTTATTTTMTSETTTTTVMVKCENCDWECPLGRPDLANFAGVPCIHTQTCEGFPCTVSAGKYLLDRPHERFCLETPCGARDRDICCGESTTTTTTVTTSSRTTTTATTDTRTSTTATTSTSSTSTSSTSTSSTSSATTTSTSTLTSTTTRSSVTRTSVTESSGTSSTVTTTTVTTNSTTTSATTRSSSTSSFTTGTVTSTSSVSTTSGTSSSSTATGTTFTTRTETTTTRTTTRTTTTRTLTPRACPELVNLITELEDARGTVEDANVMVNGLLFALVGLAALLVIMICFLCYLCCTLRKSKAKKNEEKLDEATKKAERYQALYTETHTQATQKLDEWSKKFADAHRTTIQAHDSTLRVCESMMLDRKQIGWKGEIVRAWSYYVADSRKKQEEELRRQNSELQRTVESLQLRLQATGHRLLATLLERALAERQVPPYGAREHFLAWVATHRAEHIDELQQELYKAKASSPASESVIRLILDARDTAVGPGTTAVGPGSGPPPPTDSWGEDVGAAQRNGPAAPFQRFEQLDHGSPTKMRNPLFTHGSPLHSPASLEPHMTDGPPPGAAARGDYGRPLLRQGWSGEPSPAEQEDWPAPESPAPPPDHHGKPGLLFMSPDVAQDWPAQHRPAPPLDHQDDPALPFLHSGEVAMPRVEGEEEEEEEWRPAGAPPAPAAGGHWFVRST